MFPFARLRPTGALLLLGLLLAGACSREHDMNKVKNPLDPRVTDLTPPIPHDLTARVGDRRIDLSWSLEREDSSLVGSIERYRIYRRSAQDPKATLVDSAAAPPAVLHDLQNGNGYAFSVTTVLANGLEGERSVEVTAEPAVFGVLIANGQEAVNSPNVGLSLLAPQGTTGVELSNSADFAESVPRPYAATQSWQLSPGNGTKQVFARFLDGIGNQSEVVSDTVILDDKAEIKDLTFAPTQVEPGQDIVFRLDAGEPDGEASVQLGNTGKRLQLRDDGQGADETAGDGIYTLRYTAEDDLDIIDGVVTGNFVDRAGTQAASRVADARLTVHRNPPAVILQEIAVTGPKELFLNWTQATDAGRFSSYRVYRADSADVMNRVTRRMVREITSRSTTTLAESGLETGHTYYYVVAVVDPSGSMTPSNEQSATPRLNPPPAAVTLDSPYNVTESSVSLSWSQSLAADFLQYRIHRGEQADIQADPDRRVLTTIGSSTTTTYDDRTDLEQGKTYYYQVEVQNSFGSSSFSNIVSATVVDKPPTAVTLNTPGSVGETSVLLTWSKNSEADFARYEVRRGRGSGVSQDSALVATITEAGVLNTLDTGLTEDTDYWYRVFVVDKGGSTVGSNEVTVTTRNADPQPVSLSPLTEQTAAPRPTVVLNWTVSTEHDFKEYRIYRDTSPAVGEESGTLVRTISESSVHGYTDSDSRLNDNTRYYYRVFVHDTGGANAGSGEQSILLSNRAPTPVTLQEPTVTSSTIHLSWSQNGDDDFQRYEVLQWTGDPGSAQVVASFTHKEQVSHTIAVPEHDPTRYFFKIRVWDNGVDTNPDLSSDSNVVSAKVL